MSVYSLIIDGFSILKCFQLLILSAVDVSQIVNMLQLSSASQLIIGFLLLLLTLHHITL